MNASMVLKGIRGKRLKTQENVADLLGVSRQIYNSYENDLINCELSIVFRILKCLGAEKNEISEFLFALEQDYKSYKEKNIEGE